MQPIQDLLHTTSHRPWALPKGKWKFYQEWNRAIFLHLEVSFEALRALVPEELTLDSFEGKYYISIVPFTMEGIRPRNLVAVGLVSDFDEINVRTYVVKDGKAGVYFLNIEVGKSLSAFVSRLVSGLPYEKSVMKREEGSYTSENASKGYSLSLKYSIGAKQQQKTALSIWLTERYCLYVYGGKQLYRYEIHHKEWEIRSVSFEQMKFTYRIGDLSLTEADVVLQHYSPGVIVVAWGKEKVIL